MKVLIIYDLEGVTAASVPRDVQFVGEGYPGVRESLTEDVNAAIRGLLKAGASEVVLTDGHASGNPDPDYLLERLPPGARFEVRDTPYDAYTGVLDRSFAAVVGIGMHSGSGRKGNLAHTLTGHTKWIVGEYDLNETMIIAGLASRFSVPVILVTGDDVLREEVMGFSPRTRYVTVKKALGVEKSEPRPRDVVTADIEAAAAEALRNRADVKPWTPPAIKGPVDNVFAYMFPEMALVAINYPGAEAVNNKSIRLRTASFYDGYLTFRALAVFAGLATQRMILGWVREVDGGADVYQRAHARWPTRDQRTFIPTAPGIDRTAAGMGRYGAR
ncbi:MAG: M55 family metallopeptidase [Acidobacteria bacterium]|nr:M55 family metallopeptidase [Acidobacteriota bacterium]